MDIRQIRYFLTVAEEKSITRAAERLHISQPPLSRQLKNLEEELGLTLFYRSPTGIELTKAGRLLQERGEALVHQYDLLRTDMGELLSKEQTEITFGSIDGSALSVEPFFIRMFRSKYKKSHVMSVHGTADEITDMLRAGTIDIGFVRYPFRDFPVMEECVRLTRETWVALLQPEHPLAGRKALTLSDLLAYNLVLPSRQALYLPLIRALEAAGQKPNILCYYFELSKASILACTKDRIAIVPESINSILKSGDYLLKPIIDLEEETGYMAVKSSCGFRSQEAKDFWQLIHEVRFRIK